MMATACSQAESSSDQARCAQSPGKEIVVSSLINHENIPCLARHFESAKGTQHFATMISLLHVSRIIKCKYTYIV